MFTALNSHFNQQLKSGSSTGVMRSKTMEKAEENA